jgi:hypothetical protein
LANFLRKDSLSNARFGFYFNDNLAKQLTIGVNCFAMNQKNESVGFVLSWDFKESEDCEGLLREVYLTTKDKLKVALSKKCVFLSLVAIHSNYQGNGIV